MHEKKFRRKKNTPSQDHPRDGALKCCWDGHLGRRQDYLLLRAAFLTAAFAAAGFFTAGFFFGAVFVFDFFGTAFTAFVDAFADNNFFFALSAAALPFAMGFLQQMISAIPIPPASTDTIIPHDPQLNTSPFFAFAICDASFIEFYAY
jgi:hypothetical protein